MTDAFAPYWLRIFPKDFDKFTCHQPFASRATSLFESGAKGYARLLAFRFAEIRRKRFSP